jgi:prepilin-type N-terminal cleavage/methylation domain-containing protein
MILLGNPQSAIRPSTSLRINNPKFNRWGFTLIELLIVVAIIAIIASIALYNYQGAQIRAKVSRAKGELKTVAGALESYHVDNSAYPPYHYVTTTEFYLGGWANAVGDAQPFNGANPITTPIAYISSMPNDLFNPKRDTAFPERSSYSYVNWEQAIAISGWPIFIDAQNQFGPYRIHSLGPDRDGPDSGIPYDPSNGFTSNGDIYYTPKTGFDVYVHLSQTGT